MAHPAWFRFPPLERELGTDSRNRREPPEPDLFESLASFLERADKAPARAWLLDGLVPDSGKVMIIAAPNAGKTWLALLVLKTAAGQGRECFLVEEEGGQRSLADRIRRLGLHTLDGVRVAHLRGVSIDNRQDLQTLREALKASVAPVLVLDPLNAIWGGDENDTHAATQARQKLDGLCASNHRALVIVLHHSSKAGERGEGSALYASRGSSVFAGWADCQLNLAHVPVPKDSGRVVFDASVAKMRDGERGQRVRFTLNLNSGAVEYDAPPRDVTLNVRVLDALRSSPQGLSKSGIAKLVQARKESVFHCIDQMLREKVVRLDSDGHFHSRESLEAACEK